MLSLAAFDRVETAPRDAAAPEDAARIAAAAFAAADFSAAAFSAAAFSAAAFSVDFEVWGKNQLIIRFTHVLR